MMTVIQVQGQRPHNNLKIGRSEPVHRIWLLSERKKKWNDGRKRESEKDNKKMKDENL